MLQSVRPRRAPHLKPGPTPVLPLLTGTHLSGTETRRFFTHMYFFVIDKISHVYHFTHLHIATRSSGSSGEPSLESDYPRPTLPLSHNDIWPNFATANAIASGSARP